ncbi:MAG: hypothetical protein OSA97_07925 [Nevskia sp.]|nr:hypothetical protein [Nevskia sp.]
MAVINIHCEDAALSEELLAHLLAFAKTRRLGVEHNRVKDRMVLYRGRAADAAAAPCATVIAFPLVRARRSGWS